MWEALSHFVPNTHVLQQQFFEKVFLQNVPQKVFLQSVFERSPNEPPSPWQCTWQCSSVSAVQRRQVRGCGAASSGARVRIQLLGRVGVVILVVAGPR